MWNLDVLPCVGQKAGLKVATEHLDHVAVAASHEHIQPVWSDGEVSRMDASVLISHISQETRGWILAEYGQSVPFQAVAGIKEFPVR